MNAVPSHVPAEPRPPELIFAMTGERFEFQTSAKGGDGVFRFRWTLAKGKKGPPEHVHDEESETFAVVSGTLRIWLGGVPQDVGPGQRVTVARGVRHRFFNPGPEAVVVDVSLDGPRQEDALVPLAYRLGGKSKLGFGDLCAMIVHAEDVRASRAPTWLGRSLMRALGGVFRLFGARPLPRTPAW